MIVRHGTGFRRAIREFVLANWYVILAVILVEELVILVEKRFDLVDASAFSAGAVGLLATVVGIFLAFRFNEAYQRWWEARILWGGIVNVSRSWSREVTTLLTPSRVSSLSAQSDGSEAQRRLVYRHLAFINALRLHLRGQDHWQEIEPFLSPAEFRALQPIKNKPQYIVQLQGKDIASLLSAKTSEQLLLQRFDETMNTFYDLQGGCERIKNTAFPDDVRFISRALVWAIIVSMPVVFLQPQRDSAPLEMIAVLVINLSFLIVDQLGAALKNPFENKPNDTPMSALCRSIEIDLRQQLGETELPPPLAPVDGVLM